MIELNICFIFSRSYQHVHRFKCEMYFDNFVFKALICSLVFDFWYNLCVCVCQDTNARINHEAAPSLAGARCDVAADYSKRPFIFRLKLTTGSVYLFQAKDAVRAPLLLLLLLGFTRLPSRILTSVYVLLAGWPVLLSFSKTWETDWSFTFL